MASEGTQVWQGNYQFPLDIKVSFTNWPVVKAASPPIPGDDELPTTYTELQTAHIERLTRERGTPTEQVLRNHKSVLNSYLTFCGKPLTSTVGREFTTDFLTRTREYRELVAGARKTAADKLSILRAWKKTVDFVTREARLRPVSGVSLFHKELRIAIASTGKSLVDISRAIHAAPLTLPRWMEGANPGKKGMPTLRRLENYLGLERGYLESKLENPRSDVDVSASSASDKYLVRLHSAFNDRFRLKHFPDALKAEWFDLLKYKTVEHPLGIRRSKRARWRVLDAEAANSVLLENPYCHTAPGFVCPSGGKTYLDFGLYFGFLLKEANGDVTQSGLGLEAESIQSLALLVIPEFVNAYMEFVKARSGNLVHGGHNTFAGCVASLVREKDGYLWQKPELIEAVAQYAKGRTWMELCETTREVCLSWQAASKASRKSRDPKLPLERLLRLDNPLKPFQLAIRKLDIAAANCAPGSVYQAVHKRNALLVALMLVNPLRLRTMTIAKYVPPDGDSPYTTNLYQTEDGNWRLRFFKGDFKNDGGKQDDYDAHVHTGLNRRIEEYLEIYRPVLVRNNPDSPWLFCDLGGEKHDDLSRVVATVAKNYIPEVTRLRVHALRHIVASDFLRRNPGEFLHVAELLHDTLETVLKNYAHGKREAAFKAHEVHMKGFFDAIQ